MPRVMVRKRSDVFRDAAYEAHLAGDAERAESLQEASAEAFRVESYPVYREVEVVKGRKVPIGTRGRVFWCKEGAWGWSVGIETASGEKHFTALDNVVVVDW